MAKRAAIKTLRKPSDTRKHSGQLAWQIMQIPFFIAIPCHRVIGASGSLVGYGGGLEMKKALLELERSNRE